MDLGKPSSIGLPFTHLAFFLTAELTDPVAVDSFADRRTSISRLPVMTKDQWLSGKLPGFQRQAGTAEVHGFVLIARHWLSSGDSYCGTVLTADGPSLKTKRLLCSQPLWCESAIVIFT